MKYGPMTIEYDIKGAKNLVEKIWAKKVALDIYNKSADMSQIYYAGFNAAWDFMKKHGLKLNDISIESVTDIDDPEQEAVVSEFCRGIYRAIAKENNGVMNGRIIQLDGLEAVTIQKDFSKATIHCTIEDLN